MIFVPSHVPHPRCSQHPAIYDYSADVNNAKQPVIAITSCGLQPHWTELQRRLHHRLSHLRLPIAADVIAES
jgi:hypothetical protein